MKQIRFGGLFLPRVNNHLLPLLLCTYAIFIATTQGKTEGEQSKQPSSGSKGMDYNLITKENRYVWPDEGTVITDSEKTNVTVWFGPKGYDSKVRTTFEYWTREKENKETSQSFYEFHYRCYFENLDPTDWKTDGTEVIECNFGMH